MATEYGTRLRTARKHAELTQEDLSKLTGISQSTISTAERMGHGSAETPVYARACKVNALWLATGEGKMTEAGSEPTEDDFALVQQLDVAASCGTGRFIEHVVVKGGLAFKRSSLRDFGLTEETARIIYASGGSMEPTIQDGCVVLLNTADTTPREGRVFAICQPDGDLVLKRLVMDYIPALGAQGWVMRSDNADKNKHPDKILPPDARTMIVGRALWNDNRL